LARFGQQMGCHLLYQIYYAKKDIVGAFYGAKPTVFDANATEGARRMFSVLQVQP
jgi:hypothetical protein